VSDHMHKVTAEIPWSRSTIYWRFFLVVVYAGTIFALSSVPGNNLPALGGSDKILHAIEFGGLAVLLSRALRIYTPTRSRYFIVFISGILAICYGAVD
jgi:hypothetical protein